MRLPLSLIIVAVLFILEGAFAGIDILQSLFQGKINFNLGVLSFFVGIGLLRLSARCRTYALVIIWIGIILVLAFAAAVLTQVGTLKIHLLHTEIKTGEGKEILALLLAGLVFLLLWWQYRVLTRPQIRALFRS